MNWSNGLLIALTAGLSWLGTRLVMQYAQNLGLVHIPNDRSFHSDPTPHGGGLGLALSYLLSVVLAFFIGALEPVFAACLLIGGGTLAALGLWDDRRPLPASTRLVVQCCAVVLALFLFTRHGPAANSLIGYIWYGAATLLLVWWLNLFNFMDGIDGLAALECLFLALSALALLAATGDGKADSQILLLLLLVAATSGFLTLNWPPARIFLGDVGSLFLGYVLGVLALSTVVQGQLPLTVWLILGGVFWVDSTVTLLRRMLMAEPWHAAHRSHAYQRYAALLCRYYEAGGAPTAAQARARAHRTAGLAVLSLNLLWLLPLAWLVIMKPDWFMLWLLMAWLPLLILVIQSGKYE